MTKRAGMRANILLRGSLALGLISGCGMDVDQDVPVEGESGLDQGDPDRAPVGVGEVDQSLTTVTGADFEGYSVGPLGSPWQVSRSLTTQANVESTSDHGKVLQFRGSSAAGDFLIARLTTSVSADMVASIDVKPDSGSSFIWSVHTPRYKSRIRVERWPGSGQLIANAPGSGGDVDCGSLPAGEWSQVRLVVHTSPSVTFDVLLDGIPTACQDIETSLSPGFTLVQLYDSSSQGWGGNVRFDNVTVLTP